MFADPVLPIRPDAFATRAQTEGPSSQSYVQPGPCRHRQFGRSQIASCIDVSKIFEVCRRVFCRISHRTNCTGHNRAVHGRFAYARRLVSGEHYLSWRTTLFLRSWCRSRSIQIGQQILFQNKTTAADLSRAELTRLDFLIELGAGQSHSMCGFANSVCKLFHGIFPGYLRRSGYVQGCRSLVRLSVDSVGLFLNFYCPPIFALES